MMHASFAFCLLCLTFVQGLLTNIKHILFGLVCQNNLLQIDQQRSPVEKLQNDNQQTNLAVHEVEALLSD